MKSFLIFLLPIVLCAQSVTEKKALLSQKGSSQDMQVALINEKLVDLRKKLECCYSQISCLEQEKAPEADFKALLAEVNQFKKEIALLEESWHESSVTESKSDEEGYALWNEEETTLAQLVMEYGSLDFLYIVPPEMAAMKLSMHSNIPIPRESWNNMLEVVLMHNGIGVKKLNPYARQLFILKQDLGAVRSILSKPQDLTWVPNGSRVFYLFSPPVEHVKTVFQFFERFADAKQTFVHQIGNKIALVASKEEVEKSIALYNAVWEGHEGKIAKVVVVSKMNVKEMEKVLQTFFGEGSDRPRPTPFNKPDQEGLSIFSLGQSSNLVLIGQKETVERAERLVKETEEQLEDPTEMTVFVYGCRHSDPTDLAKILEKVYVSLLNSSSEGPTKETDISVSRQGPMVATPDGYAPSPPLVVAPPPLKPGVATTVDIEQGFSEHFIPDPKSGTLLMTVQRDVLPKIKELLKKLDVPKKMVQLEVLLFERRLNSQNNFGLNLLRLGKNDNGARYTPAMGPQVSEDHAAKGVLQFFFHGPGNKYIPNFDIAYNFLMAQEDIQLNAAPSVITVNQSPATISIVEELSINNGAAPIDTNKGIAFEKSFTRSQYGITIILTPTIHTVEANEKGLVTLKTNISFDTTKAHPDDRPLVDRRHIENEVRVVDGETIILGGLRRKSKQDNEEKIPFFGEIPGFGKLFGSTRLTNHDTEMFFFITPKIVYDSKDELILIRTEELKKRPGDNPEFLVRMDEARDKARKKYFQQSMQLFFNYER